MIALSSNVEKQPSANSFQLSSCGWNIFAAALESSPMFFLQTMKSACLISALRAGGSFDLATKTHSACAASISNSGCNPHATAK
jgi:hypothetical protein